MTILKNILNIIINPVKLFKYTEKHKNSWIVPFIIIFIILLITNIILIPNVLIPGQINQFTSDSDMNSSDIEKTINFLNSPYHYVTTFFYNIFTKLLYYPILAFLFTILPLLFGGKTKKYSYVFSAVAYTGILNSIGFLIDTIIKFQYNCMDIGLNLGLIFNSYNSLINYFFKNINIFGIWQIFLLTILISTYFKYSKFKSFLIIFNPWFLMKIISAYYLHLKLIIK